MASNITVDTLTKGSTTLNTDEIVDTNSSQVCKAWVNFNGTGTVAIRDSFNISSVTDNGTGNYNTNFTAAMSNADFSVIGTAGRTASIHGSFTKVLEASARTTSTVQVATTYAYDTTETPYDYDIVSVVVFGN